MAIVGFDEIDNFTDGLEESNVLLMAGKGCSLGICEIRDRLIVNTANSGKKVAYFDNESYRNYATYLKETFDVQNPENITVFVPGSRKEDSIDIPNQYSITKIRSTLDKQLKKGIRYDLVIIETIDKTLDFIYDRKYLFSITNLVRNQMAEYQAAVVTTVYFLEDIYSLDSSEELEDKLFYDVRDNVDFLMFVDDRYSDDPDETDPYQFDVKLLDCRTREIDLSYFCDIKESRVCRKEGKALELFRKAKALGLCEADASAYATYWIDHEEDYEDEFADMRFSQGDEDETEMKCLLQEDLFEYEKINRRAD